MNLRQKKKLFKKITGYNPRGISYGDSGYHAAINKPWGGLAEYKRLKLLTVSIGALTLSGKALCFSTDA